MKYEILESMFAGENPQSVFEVGCANGGLLEDLGIKIVGGIDKTTSDIEKAKILFPKCKDNFFVGDIENIPWPVKDKQYDIVFTVGTLMYVENYLPVLKEMLRIGKKVILAEPTEGEVIKDIHGIRYYHEYPGEIKGEIVGKTIFICNKI